MKRTCLFRPGRWRAATWDRPYNALETCPLIRHDLRSCHLPPKGKAYGPPQGSPLQRKPDHERWFGKPRRRCGTAPAAIFANPGPSGPEGIAEAAPFLRAGNPATSNNRASPVMGSGVRRIWARSAHPEPSPGDPQGELPRRGKRRWPGPLVSFPSLGKKLAARRRRNNPLRTTYPIQNLSPHPPPSGAPFPIPSVASRHLPLTRGVGPQGGG